MKRASLVKMAAATPVAGAALGLAAAVAGLSGCGGGNTPDMATTVTYATIQADMKTQGCLLSSCHGSPGTTTMNNLILDMSGTQLMANYTLLTTTVPAAGGKYIDTTNPANSLLLTKPLNTGASHTMNGAPGPVFASTSDPTYQKWLTWITKGAPYM